MREGYRGGKGRDEEGGREQREGGKKEEKKVGG